MTACGTYSGRASMDTGVRLSNPISAICSPSWEKILLICSCWNVRIWAMEGQASPAHRFCQVPQAPPRARAAAKVASTRNSRGYQNRSYFRSQVRNPSSLARRPPSSVVPPSGRARAIIAYHMSDLPPGSRRVGACGSVGRCLACKLATGSIPPQRFCSTPATIPPPDDRSETGPSPHVAC